MTLRAIFFAIPSTQPTVLG